MLKFFELDIEYPSSLQYELHPDLPFQCLFSDDLNIREIELRCIHSLIDLVYPDHVKMLKKITNYCVICKEPLSYSNRLFKLLCYFLIPIYENYGFVCCNCEEKYQILTK